jgi:hypothetical protein
MAYASKEALPMWSPATYREGYRNRDYHIASHAIAYDFDKGAPRAAIVASFGACAGFAHTTWSSSPECLRWRVVVRLSRPVDADEHDRVWKAGAECAERTGLALDYNAKDASRAWALPAARPGYEYLLLGGSPIRVEAALDRFPAPSEMPVAPPVAPADAYDRARKYVAQMPEAISGAGGHAATFKAALVLTRGFNLSDGEALALLVNEYNPRCAPPWSRRELQHKIKQARQRGRLPAGWLADRHR